MGSRLSKDSFFVEQEQSSGEVKQVFLKVLEGFQENTCVGVSFLIKLKVLRSSSL